MNLHDAIEEALDALEMAATRVGSPRNPADREPIHPWLRRAIYWRDSNQCGWCLTTWGDDNNQLVLDHIRPWADGGSDRSDNLRTLCRICNDRRSNYATDSWVRVTPVGLCDECHARGTGEWLEPGRRMIPIFCGHCGNYRASSDPRRVI